MLATLLTETGPKQSFSWSGLVIVLIVFAVLFPLQARLRKKISEARRQRWAELEAQQQTKQAGHNETGRPARPPTDDQPSVDHDPPLDEEPPPDDGSPS
ncbi:MAG: hypothetical protein ABIZ07_11535 [Dermatophilaceae bacterium]